MKKILFILLVSMVAFSCSTQKLMRVSNATKYQQWPLTFVSNLPLVSSDTGLNDSEVRKILSGSKTLLPPADLYGPSGYVFSFNNMTIDTVLTLRGNETIIVGDSTYSLKELIDAKKKNEVLEEMLLKMVVRQNWLRQPKKPTTAELLLKPDSANIKYGIAY
jgi:hypothetical protein